MNNAALEKRKNRIDVPERIDQDAWYTPLVDILETGENFIFHADLPGVKPEDVDVSFENGVLTLSGKIRRSESAENRQYVWQEYGLGHFYRQFSLNTPVDVNGIQAELKNGELKLTLPKATSARLRKVEVKGA